MFKRTKQLIPRRGVGKLENRKKQSEYMSFSLMITLIPVGIGLVTGVFYIKESLFGKSGYDYLLWNEFDNPDLRKEE